jgi:hypothetical protein
MSPKGTGSKSTASESERLEVIKHDKEAGEFVVRHHPTGNISRVVDTFAEMFPTLATSPTVQPSFLLAKNF